MGMSSALPSARMLEQALKQETERRQLMEHGHVCGCRYIGGSCPQINCGCRRLGCVRCTGLNVVGTGQYQMRRSAE